MNIYINVQVNHILYWYYIPANNHQRFRKRYFKFIIIITLTNKLKILDDKIKADKSEYDLGREAAKISALSSKELDKYEQWDLG